MNFLKNVVLFLFSFVFFDACLWEDKPDTPKRNGQVISLNNHKVYVSWRYWGLNGDHQEIIFSEKIFPENNTESSYIFYTSEVFYKIENDSLIIYAPKSGKKLPSVTFKSINIVIRWMNNFGEIKEMNENFSKYNLKRISVYDN